MNAGTMSFLMSELLRGPIWPPVFPTVGRQRIRQPAKSARRLMARDQVADATGDFAAVGAHPRIEAARYRLAGAPYPEATRFGYQSMTHRTAIGFGEVVENDAAPGAAALGDRAAAVQQLRVPDEHVAPAGLEQFALEAALLHLGSHPR